MWDLLTTTCLFTLDRFLTGKQGILCLDELNNGLLVNVNIWQHFSILILDFSKEKRECVSVLKGHSDYIRCVRLLHGSESFATGSADCTIRIWSSQHEIATLRGHTDNVTDLSESIAHGLISSSSDHTIRV